MKALGLTKKTLAIAIAAGVTLGGVQVVGAERFAATADAATVIPAGVYPEVSETKWVWEEKSDRILALVSAEDLEKGSFTIKGLVDPTRTPPVAALNGGSKPLEPNKKVLLSEEDSPNFSAVEWDGQNDVTYYLRSGITRSMSEEQFVGGDFALNPQLTIPNMMFVGASRLATPVVTVEKQGDSWVGELPEFDSYNGSIYEGKFSVGRYAFPAWGQPAQVQKAVDAIEDKGRFGINIYEIAIPGEGTWKINNEDVPQSVTFTPEEGFTGRPTFPRIGSENFSNGSAFEDVFVDGVSDENRDFFEKARWFYFNNISYVWPEDLGVRPTDGDDIDPNEIPVPKPEPELHVTDVEKQPNGDYLVTRNDGQTWTIGTGELEKRIKNLEDKNSPSAEDFKQVQDDLKDAQDKIAELEKSVGDNKNAIDDLKKDVDGLKDRVDDLEGRVKDLEDQGIKEVRNDGEGNYTVIRNDGSVVPGVIETGGNVKEVVANEDGSITIIKVDGSEEKVNLSQVTITEENAGKPNHTITITSPNGDTVTFNAYDNQVVDVKKLANGDYEITRKDGKKWTIKLSDIRDAVKALEDKDSPTRDEFDKVKDDITQIRTDVAQNAANIADNAGDILQLNRDLDALDKRVDDIEDRVKKLEDNAIKSVEDDGKGNYTLIRENGERVNAVIKTGDSVTGIVDNGDGSITLNKKDGSTQTVKLSQVKLTEQNAGKPNHTITITTPDGQSVTFDAYDNHVVGVKKLPNGDYEVSRNDGKKWTIKLDDIRKKIADLEAKDSPSRDEFKAVQDDIKAIQDEVADLTEQVGENTEGIADLVADVDGLDKRVTDLEGRVDKLEANGIKEVKDDGKGNYTLIRNDGSTVNAVIKTGGNVKQIVANKDGSITVVNVDGSKEKVNLSQVKITESKKGTPEHTVTITTPNGETVTFNVFDKYVTDVKKNSQGNYDIYRSDIDGGKKVWKTIDISDLRKQIAALEAKDSPSRAEFDALVKKIADLKVEINQKFVNVEGDINELKADLGDLDARLKSLEARVGKLEETDEAWAKCYSGIATASLPALIALPLGLLSQVNIPGLAEMNTNIQKQIGLYNPELAKAWERNGGILQAVGAVALLGGVIGAIVHASKACAPYNQTDAAKNTDIAKLSSKAQGLSSKRAEKKQSKKAAESPAPATETATPVTESETPKAEPKEKPAA